MIPPTRWDHSPFYDSIPTTLQQKYDKKLHRSCIFLCSIYENDYQAVGWMLEHDKGHTIEKPVSFNQDDYSLLSNRFYYYSLCAREYNPFIILTPFDITYLKNNAKMITLLRTHFPNIQPIARNTMPPFDLFMKACSKPTAYGDNEKQQIKSIALNARISYVQNNDHVQCRHNNNWLQLLMLIAFVNHDQQLKNILEQNSYYACTPVLNFIGSGWGASLFVTDQEITFLFNHPWITKENKQEYVKAIEKDKQNFGPSPTFFILNEREFPHFERVLTVLKNNIHTPKKVKTEKTLQNSTHEKPPLTFNGIMRSFLFVAFIFLLCRYCK